MPPPGERDFTMASKQIETGFRLHRNAGRALASLLLTLATAAEAQKRCDWHGPRTRGETSYKQCVDYATLNGKTQEIPANVTRISQDGISFCANTFRVQAGAADIIYLMDNSGSMESGENAGGFNTPPGDPFGVRDRVIRRAMRQHRASVDTGTAGFISFFGLANNQNFVTTPEIETHKLQRPLDIGLLHPQGEQNLTTLTRKVWKHNANEALLPKVSAEAKAAKQALTYWSESLMLARAWLKPESSFVKTKNHAIILLSDGAIGDWREVETLAPTLPPVYGIHLGRDDNGAQHLRDLCTLTKGQFFLVSPTDTAVFATVMSRIVGIITKNPLPKEVTVSNSSLPTPQTSRSLEMIPNPDGSLGLVLDSIIGLKEGANQVSIQVTKDDNSVTTWSFGLNVAGSPISATGGNYTCHDMPRLMAVDSDRDSLPVYDPDATQLGIQLSRSPSELKGVHIGASSETGDTEKLPLKEPNSSLGYPVHLDNVKFNGKDGTPTPGNGTLEVGNTQNVTLTWSHPRDPREHATYFLLGKIVPVLVAKIDIVGPTKPVQGVAIKDPPKGADPVVILDRNGRCTGANCGGVSTLVMDRDIKPNLPRWDATVRSPVRITMKIFDNLGQFVNESRQEISAEQWDALPKEGDSARVSIHFLPIAKDGQTLGTGAYLMKMDIRGIGGKLQRNSAGELVEMKAVRQEYFKRFGYVR